jgi:hypothetical protein
MTLSTMALNIMTHRLMGLIRTLSVNVTKEMTMEIVNTGAMSKLEHFGTKFDHQMSLRNR